MLNDDEHSSRDHAVAYLEMGDLDKAAEYLSPGHAIAVPAADRAELALELARHGLALDHEDGDSYIVRAEGDEAGAVAA